MSKVKNVNIAIPAGIKDELDVHFNWVGRSKGERLTPEQVDTMVNGFYTTQLYKDEHVDEEIKGMLSEKALEMRTLQGALNVFIAVGLQAYQECVIKAKDKFPSMPRENSYCRRCEDRVVSVGECCEECGEYVVMDDV
jgi:hypothetical protein